MRVVLAARLAQTEADYDDDVIDARRSTGPQGRQRDHRRDGRARSPARGRGAAAPCSSPILSAVDPGAAFLAAPPDVQRAVINAALTVEVLPRVVRGAAWSSQRVRFSPVA